MTLIFNLSSWVTLIMFMKEACTPFICDRVGLVEKRVTDLNLDNWYLIVDQMSLSLFLTGHSPQLYSTNTHKFNFFLKNILKNQSSDKINLN